MRKVNYANFFCKQKKEETDEEFKEIFDKLKGVQAPNKRGSNDNVMAECMSLKEEAMLGNEFLGWINSPAVMV